MGDSHADAVLLCLSYLLLSFLPSGALEALLLQLHQVLREVIRPSAITGEDFPQLWVARVWLSGRTPENDSPAPRLRHLISYPLLAFAIEYLRARLRHADPTDSAASSFLRATSGGRCSLGRCLGSATFEVSLWNARVPLALCGLWDFEFDLIEGVRAGTPNSLSG